jgi:succinoglycan biosynthesis protein ExoL
MALVVFFASDIAEASQIRRISSIRSLGHHVLSYSFRRTNMNRDFVPDWANVPLGITRNEGFLRRLGSIGAGFLRSFRARAALADSQVWIARNLDLLVIAWALKAVTGRSDVALVYECLDIHGLMTRKGVVGSVLRWAERRLLARSEALILSSPGFLRDYFRPLQGYRGRTILLENKLWIDAAALARPEAVPARDGPLVLGWVGSLRCRESLSLLTDVARDMGENIRIVMHGTVHRHALPDFDAAISAGPNITYAGPYSYPADLASIYGSCDLVWAQDLWQSGANSDWLLPNRIYEASYFGCPSIAVDGTETARRISEDGLGYTIALARAAELSALLRGLDRKAVGRIAAGLLAKPETDFRLSAAELAAALDPFFSGTRPLPRKGRGQAHAGGPKPS